MFVYDVQPDTHRLLFVGIEGSIDHMASLLARSPLTEAVIEFRLSQPVAPADLEKVRERLSRSYPHLEMVTDISFNLDPSAKSAKIRSDHAGFRMTSIDASSIVRLTPQSLATSVLAPYPGWDQFLALVRENWKIWRKVAKGGLTRVGCRYINRIDIPLGDGKIRIEDYFTMYPHLPSDDEDIGHFVMQIGQVIPEHKAFMAINMASMPGAIINSVSILLDIDIFRQENLANDDKQVWDLLEHFRTMKNDRFWDVTTEKARELFQ